MSFNIFRRPNVTAGLATSQLFNETTFYAAFLRDLSRCRQEVVIESPFITGKRMAALTPVLQKLRQRNVRVTVNTRDPQEHEGRWRFEAEDGIGHLQFLGVQVLYTTNHHRKLAVLDGKILWEGSLNILSQGYSCEIMRRIESEELARQMIGFVKIGKFL